MIIKGTLSIGGHRNFCETTVFGAWETRERVSLSLIVLCSLVVVFVSVPWGFAASVGRVGSLYDAWAGSRDLEEAYRSGPRQQVVFPGGGSVWVGMEFVCVGMLSVCLAPWELSLSSFLSPCFHADGYLLASSCE